MIRRRSFEEISLEQNGSVLGAHSELAMAYDVELTCPVLIRVYTYHEEKGDVWKEKERYIGIVKS